MSRPLRVVLDTNVLVSAALTPGGKPRRAVDLAARRGLLLFSSATHDELAEVLARPRLARYLPAGEPGALLGRIGPVSLRVDPAERIAACRDPKDDKFLDAAVYGGADYLVSGDEDLLVLHPFRGVPILTPAAFLEAVGAGE